MKQNLQRTSEWIELFLNYAVVFCIEIALNALIGDRVPVRVWLAAALYPVCFYLFRKKLKHFWVFFLLHPAVVVFATLMVKSWPVGGWQICRTYPDFRSDQASCKGSHRGIEKMRREKDDHVDRRPP